MEWDPLEPVADLEVADDRNKDEATEKEPKGPPRVFPPPPKVKIEPKKRPRVPQELSKVEIGN